jgi:hypothetical protein
MCKNHVLQGGRGYGRNPSLSERVCTAEYTGGTIGTFFESVQEQTDSSLSASQDERAGTGGCFSGRRYQKAFSHPQKDKGTYSNQAETGASLRL